MYKEVNSKFQFLGCLSFWRLFLGFFHFGVVFKFLVILIVGVVFIFGVVFFFEVVFILGLYSFLKFLSFLGSSSFLGFFHFWIQYTYTTHTTHERATACGHFTAGISEYLIIPTMQTLILN